jgi:hypothetical protein
MYFCAFDGIVGIFNKKVSWTNSAASVHPGMYLSVHTYISGTVVYVDTSINYCRPMYMNC